MPRQEFGGPFSQARIAAERRRPPDVESISSETAGVQRGEESDNAESKPQNFPFPLSPVRLVGGRFSLESGDRVLQYQAVFESGNGDSYPILDRVTIELSSE